MVYVDIFLSFSPSWIGGIILETSNLLCIYIQDIFFKIIIRLFEEKNLYGEEAEIKNMKAEKSYGRLLYGWGIMQLVFYDTHTFWI